MVNDLPFVSIIFLSYQQEAYVEDALSSILNQSYDNVEVIISDDASTDGTQNIIRSVLKDYRGPKKIIESFNLKNLGLVNNLNKCLHLASGSFIVLAAGDDISFRDRVTRSVDLLRAEGISAVSFSDVHIDEKGNELNDNGKHYNKTFSLDDYLDGVRVSPSGASRAFKRELFCQFEDLYSECPTEDTPFILRALYLGDFFVCKDPGIRYRVHSRSLSAPASRYRMDISALTKQYLHDACSAFQRGFIDYSAFLRVVVWIDRTNSYRSAARDLFSSNNKISHFLKNVAFSRRVKLYDKIRLVKLLIRFLFMK